MAKNFINQDLKTFINSSKDDRASNHYRRNDTGSAFGCSFFLKIFFNIRLLWLAGLQKWCHWLKHYFGLPTPSDTLKKQADFFSYQSAQQLVPLLTFTLKMSHSVCKKGVKHVLVMSCFPWPTSSPSEQTWPASICLILLSLPCLPASLEPPSVLKITFFLKNIVYSLSADLEALQNKSIHVMLLWRYKYHDNQHWRGQKTEKIPNLTSSLPQIKQLWCIHL